MKEAKDMAKRRASVMYHDAKYVRRRRWAAAAIIALAMFVAMLFYPVLDGVAEGACVTQLDGKSEWAVAYSKERGEYVYE